MRPVDAIDVPADAHVELAPQGLHLMLWALRRRCAAARSFHSRCSSSGGQS